MAGIILVYLVLIDLALLSGTGYGTTNAILESNACYTSTGCGSHSLTCSSGSKIFIIDAQYGYKPMNSDCKRGAINCSACCHAEQNDCLLPVSYSDNAVVFLRCWRRTKCIFYAPINTGGCNSGTVSISSPSTFSVVKYQCLNGSVGLRFSENRSVKGRKVFAWSYNLRGYTSLNYLQRWNCVLSTEECPEVTVDVMFIRYDSWSNGNCSTIEVNNIDMLPCVGSLVYTTYSIQTPFNVSLRSIYKIPWAIWTVVTARNNAILKLKCGANQEYYEQVRNRSCQVMTSTQPSSAPDDNTSPTATSGSTIRNASTGDADNTNTAAIAGGVTGALVRFAVVIFLVVCLIRRSSGKINNQRNISQIVVFAASSPVHLDDDGYESFEAQNEQASVINNRSHAHTTAAPEAVTHNGDTIDYDTLEVPNTIDHMHSDLDINLDYDDLSREAIDVLNYDAPHAMTSSGVCDYELTNGVIDNVDDSTYV